MECVGTEAPGDAPAIHALHLACFPSELEACLVDALRSSGRLTLSLAAFVDEVLVGHVAFSPVTLESGPPALGLGPVGVAVTHRRRGIAERLIRQGLAECARQNVPAVVVLGEPAYYARFGFRPAREFGLTDEYGGGDAFQALEISPGALADASGLVRYSPEFNVFALMADPIEVEELLHARQVEASCGHHQGPKSPRPNGLVVKYGMAPAKVRVA